MRWKAKSAVLNVLDKLPGGENINYLLQRYITRSLPRAPSTIPGNVSDILTHVQAFRNRGLELDKRLWLSFGAGWDLLENLIFYGYGVNRQIAIDIKPHARIATINAMADYLDKNRLDGQTPRPFPPLQSNLREELLGNYGIDYRAPSDARAVPLPSGSVDMIETTVTLQNIPSDQIVEILKECRRLINASGAVSMLIDYSDHFSHMDRSITQYNFLRFLSDEWRRHNVGMHFQNRLRHCDFARLFEDAGFRIVTETATRPPNWDVLLARQPIAPEFQHYALEDLAITKGHFLLVPETLGQRSRGS